MNSEPSRIVGAINAAIIATLAVLVALGVDDTLVTLLGAAAAAWVLVGAELVRSRVTPTSTLRPGQYAAKPKP